MGIVENKMNPQVDKNINVFEHPADKEISHKGTVIFKQLRALRWPDLLTLLGLLCVSFSVYFSFKGILVLHTFLSSCNSS
jgi:hypothetical protein